MIMKFKPIKTKKIHEEIIEQIQEMISDGTLKAGDKLLPERDLAEMLGVSRASIREAISALAVLGVLEVRRGEGTFINGKFTRDSFNPLSILMLLDKTLEVLEIRKILESEGAALAAERASEDDIQKIGKAVDDMEEDVKKGGLGDEGDYVFHYNINQAAHNCILLQMIDAIMETVKMSLKVSRQSLYKLPKAPEILLEQHRAIFDSIAKRDAQKAKEEMKKHLEYVEEKILYFENEAERGDK
jgi:GntR family transcriptional repressor for pyruvate dehydrogenase complex